MGKKRTKAPTNTQADSNNVSNQTSSSSEKANGGTKFRNQFWSSNSSSKKNTNGGGHMSNKGTEEQPPKRPESSVSRQFLPKKQQGVSEQWTKQSLENKEEQNQQPFNYTPFKSNTSNSRPPSANGLRGAATPSLSEQPIFQPFVLQQQQQQQQQQSVFNASRTQQSSQNQLKPPYLQSPLNAAGHPYQLYADNIPQNEMNPQGQSTPKMAAQHTIRPHDKVHMPAGPYRPASAMIPPAVPRPTSRANSEVGVGLTNVGMGSRYQSYCTLPRPEQIEFEQHPVYGNDISHMAQQISMLYGPYTQKATTNDMQQPIYMQNQIPASAVNRPASQMLAGAPGMASDYMQQRTAPQPTSVYDVERPVSAPGTEDGILKPQKDIVYFDALSLLSVFQVLCAIVIFTCGMLRLIWHAKWAIGVELAFAVYVFICGIMGIYANTKRSHCAAVGTYVMSAFATFAALIPLILGLFPTIPLTFPSADSDSFVNEDESRLVDYLLSFACFVELVVALITSIYGCQSIGTTMTHVEKLRLNADLNAAFESSSTSLPKSSQHSNRNAAALHLEKKASLQF